LASFSRVELAWRFFQPCTGGMKILLATFMILTALAGCKRETPPPVPSEPRQMYPTKAQPKLQTIKLWMGAAELEAELALTNEQRQTGMMFRKTMGENEGMLFVFPWPHQTGFWMLNTYVPLSIAYMDPAGVIVEIHNLQPQDTNSVVAASSNIVYALETPQGWFERHGVRPGTRVVSERGPLPDIFTFGQPGR